MLKGRPGRVSASGLAAVAVALVAASTAPAAEPLAAPPPPGERSLDPLDLPFLHFGPLRPRDGSGIDVSVAGGNTFSHSWHAMAIKTEFGTLGQPFTLVEAEELHRRHPQDTIYFIDGDVSRVSLLGWLSIGGGFSAGLEIPWISFDALHLDSFIEGFHQVFGLADSQRPSFPRNRFQVVLQAPYGPLRFFDRIPGPGIGDVVTTLTFRHGIGGGWNLAAQLALKLPSGNADELRGSGSVDGGLLVDASTCFGSTRRWTLRLDGGLVLPGPYRGGIPLGLDPSLFWRLSATGQLRIGSKTWVSLGGAAEESPLHRQNLGDVAAAAGTATLGVSRSLFRRALVELWLTEHLPRYGDTADVTFGLRMRYAPGL